MNWIVMLIGTIIGGITGYFVSRGLQKLHYKKRSKLAHKRTDELMAGMTYGLNCDKCGEPYISKDGFPKPQLCDKCKEVPPQNYCGEEAIGNSCDRCKHKDNNSGKEPCWSQCHDFSSFEPKHKEFLHFDEGQE